MAHVIWHLLSHPVRTLAFLYTFSTQLSLILLKRILLPHFPNFQTLRLQAQRAYLSSTLLHLPDLLQGLPATNTPETQARRIGEKFTAYIIPGTDRLEESKEENNNARKVVVLYAHGGGYASGEARMYMKYMRRWKRKAWDRGLDLTFVSVEYPLSTSEQHPAQLNSFLATYRHLMDIGISPSRIVFMGDSAGGGLSVLAGIELLGSDLPQPAASVLVSPWMDMNCTAYEGGNALIETDYLVLANAFVPSTCQLFAGEAACDSPEVNPLYREPKELQGLNKQLILVGAGEFCSYDSREWARILGQAGVEHKIIVEHAQMHIYAMGSDWIDPEVVRKTDNYILDWIQQATGELTGSIVVV